MNAGEAVRIMTGAPVPIGADSVQQVELTREKDNIVQIDEPVTLGRSIVLRGSEIRRGEKVFRAGERINAALVAVLASFGYAEVKVGCRPRVAVIATGTELVEVNKSPGQDQIRDSNNYSIEVYAALAGAQVERFPLAGDDRELLAQQISASASHCDVVVTSGGVSMGVYDFTKTALRDLGAEIFFERVALRPGKPTVFGRLPNGALVFGLPGNPVSVSVTFNLFARTALLLMQGAADPDLARESAILIRAIQGNAERDSYLPASLTTNEHGLLQAEPLKWGGSSDFIGFARADALIVIPMQTHYSAGDVVQALKLPR